MVQYFVSRDLAGGFCLENDIQKVFPFQIAQQMLQVSSEPKLDAFFRLLCMWLKGARERDYRLVSHALPFIVGLSGVAELIIALKTLLKNS